MRRLALVAPLLALLAAAAPSAAQQAPERLAKPGGVYKGKVVVSGHSCGRSGCKVTVVVTSDGLEVTPESDLDLPRCYDGALEYTGITSSGRFASDLDEHYETKVQGRFARDGRTLSGAGQAFCDVSATRTVVKKLRFSARLVRQRKRPPATAVQHCARLESVDFKQVYVPTAKGLGCGRAHDALRQVARLEACAALRGTTAKGSCKASGLTCRPASGTLLDPAAQIRCGGAKRIVDLARLADCGSGGQDSFVWATPAVGCAAAKRLDWEETCSPYADDPPDGPCEIGGFRCVTLEDAADPEDFYQRCSDVTDPRRVAEFLYATSDVV